MKQKYINKGKYDKSKYLNNPPIITTKKSTKIKISTLFSKM